MRYQKKTSRVDWLNPAEVQAMIAHAPRLRDKAILKLLADVGMRVGELVGLSMGDILWADKTLRIVWQKHGGGERRRLVPIDARTLEVLRCYVAERRQGPPESPVFLNPQGERLSSRSVQVLVSRWGRTVTTRGEVTPHTLRHSLATKWIEAGGSIVALQLMLGHDNLSTTQTYVHASAEFVRHEYDAIMNKVKQ
jgi:site-specific recombinase XerD